MLISAGRITGTRTAATVPQAAASKIGAPQSAPARGEDERMEGLPVIQPEVWGREEEVNDR
jgi:hypothetical protein